MSKISKKYKKNELARTAKTIPYNVAYRKTAGSVTATILWQQMEYWFSITEGEPFFKFLSPLKEENFGYKKGDSWTEELGFSGFEFRSAFSKIGIAYKSKKEADNAEDKFKGKMYYSYYDKINHKTWYFRNQELIETHLRRLRNLIYGDEETQSTEMKKLNVDILHKNTTENTTENIYIAVFTTWNESKIIKHKQLTKGMKKKIDYALKTYSLVEIKESIKKYARILNSPDTWYTHKFTLEEFLSRGANSTSTCQITKFLDKPYEDFLNIPTKKETEVVEGSPEHLMKIFLRCAEEKNKRYADFLKRFSVKHNIPYPLVEQEIEKFISHWSELTKDGKHQRWETQNAFELEKRIQRWFNNKAEWEIEKKKTTRGEVRIW